MNRDETHELLRARSSLTSQPYGDDTIELWHHALHEWTYGQCRDALVKAARDEKRVTVAHLTERLPHHHPITPPPTPDPRPRSSIDDWINTHGGRRPHETRPAALKRLTENLP